MSAHLNYNGDKESEPDDMEDEEEGHEEVEDVVDREHLYQLECGEGELRSNFVPVQLQMLWSR